MDWFSRSISALMRTAPAPRGRLIATPPQSAMADTATGEGCEHWRQNPDSAFPYYVFRTADLGINKALTWNVVSFRYRDAFNPDEHFITPQLATGLTYKLDEQRSILSRPQRNWHDGSQVVLVCCSRMGGLPTQSWRLFSGKASPRARPEYRRAARRVGAAPPFA